jgi:L-seryl-tRNA(Ser) seleniumtransferase
MDTEDPRARIPQVEVLLSAPEVLPFIGRLSRPLTANIIASALGEFRKGLSPETSGDSVAGQALLACVAALEAAERRRLGKVLNGTGVVLHTNLGRSPLSRSAWSRIEGINTGYSNLEFKLDSGERGPRGGLVPELLQVLSGAEAGLAVNNNAAAVLLALSALAAGREVIVSRGEAVQIGGGFRIPDILALSGATLVEVGTTNITTIDDYLGAVGPETALVLVVHSSNFALRGFAERPLLSRLAKALPSGLPLVVDQGSGATGEALPEEESVQRILKSGASLVCFSGDKILGGPQAGLVVGRADLVARLARHPLMRCFRPGKTILSILEEVLIERLGREAGRGGAAGAAGAAKATKAAGAAEAAGATEIPGVAGTAGATCAERALSRTVPGKLSELRAFGHRILRTLPRDRASLVASRATLGGGSTPDEFLASAAISLSPLRSASRLARALRSASVPLVARIEGEKVIVDLLALADEDPRLIASVIAEAFALEAGT